MRELNSVTGDPTWLQRASELATSIDDVLWNDEEGLWSDLAIAGPSDSVTVPTLDGVLAAMCTSDNQCAALVLEQLLDETRFGARCGLAYVARSHHLYRGDLYWRGAAWPQLNHLARVAAVRWNRNGRSRGDRCHDTPRCRDIRFCGAVGA